MATACGGSRSSAGELVWHGCDDFECATLDVPNDYEHPESGEQHLALARARAEDPDERLGVLLYNLGGPGEVGAQALRGIHATFATLAPELTRRFDLVGFDPRGVGDSTPSLHYLDDDALEKIAALPATIHDGATQAERDAAADEVLSEAAGLDPAFATHVDSESVARDMDRIRQALGETSLNYYGASYGSFLGAIYVTLFPDRVRAFVLDSAVGPVVDRETLLLGHARAYEDALDEFADWCAATPDCALSMLGDGASIVQAIRDLVAGADTSPLPVGDRNANGGDLLTALAIGLAEGRSGWPRLASTTADMLNGDASFALGLADNYDGRGPDGRLDDDIVGANLAIQTLDAGFPGDFTRAAFDDWVASDVIPAGPTFGLAISDTDRLTLGWPFQKPKPFVTIDGRAAPPLLILAGAHDPATPPEWGATLRDALANGSAMVTLEDSVHGQFIASDCVRGVAVPFFSDPTNVPADSTCAGPNP